MRMVRRLFRVGHISAPPLPWHEHLLHAVASEAGRAPIAQHVLPWTYVGRAVLCDTWRFACLLTMSGLRSNPADSDDLLRTADLYEASCTWDIPRTQDPLWTEVCSEPAKEKADIGDTHPTKANKDIAPPERSERYLGTEILGS